ncbi:cylicin-1 [Microtus pennsylvanicus]|uniref:cylicin-1 n=1 Tax=Microtus pennsylvanicus TaxID=10058 RepID=UPI003F6B22BC
MGNQNQRNKEKLINEDAETSNSTCRLELNTTTYDSQVLIGQKTEKWNQENTKIPLPDTKKGSGSSELQIAVPRKEKRIIEKGQKTTSMWINQCFRELFLKPPFSLAFIMQAPFEYLYNPQNNYIMAETRKSKDDKRTTLKKKSKEKLSSSAINLEPKKMITDGKPEINNAEKNSSKLSHKRELFKKPNATSETNLESNNSQITMEMDSRIVDKDLMNSKETNNEATFWKDNPNTDSKMRSKEFSDNTLACINTSNMDLMLFLNKLKDELIKPEEWSTNCSQNNAKKPAKKGGKKEKDSDLDSGDSKDAKKEGKKKEKKEPRKKKDTESTGGESGDSKDAKKELRKDKKEKKEVKKKKDTDSTDAESGDSKVSKKDKKEKNADKKGSETTDDESVDSKGEKKEKRRLKKDDKKDAFYTDSESDAETKKDKKNEKKENKENRKRSIKDTLSTDADSESESDPTVKKGEKKDKKITKKGEKKDAKKPVDSTASESEIEVKKEKKEAMKDLGKDICTDSVSDGSSKADIRRAVRLTDTESEGSLVFKVIKTTDDSDATSTDSRKLTSEQKRRFRSSSKKTTFRESGERDRSGRIPSSRERLSFPPCEPLQTSPKPKRVCHCKMAPPTPKPRYAPLPEAKWIHKLL